jgi:ectoine hydroxylase-related dioxygenase (phytanoyl-CoA dioxygenase family)
MTKVLSGAELKKYQQDGFCFPLPAIGPDAAQALCRRLTDFEAEHEPLPRIMRQKVHLLFTGFAELVRSQAILDAVEDVIGPDILIWGTSLFMKDAGDPAFVSWHQDSTYWGLEPPDVVTAWVALSDVPAESGAMTFIPGSHTQGQLDHQDTFDKNNLLTRGQTLDVDDSRAVTVPLSQGEMSLHHVRLVHASSPNETALSRVGIAIRCVPPHVRQTEGRTSATLVRGRDEFGHFEKELRPTADMTPEAIAAHEAVMNDRLANLYAGAETPPA